MCVYIAQHTIAPWQSHSYAQCAVYYVWAARAVLCVASHHTHLSPISVVVLTAIYGHNTVDLSQVKVNNPFPPTYSCLPRPTCAWGHTGILHTNRYRYGGTQRAIIAVRPGCRLTRRPPPIDPDPDNMMTRYMIDYIRRYATIHFFEHPMRNLHSITPSKCHSIGHTDTGRT